MSTPAFTPLSPSRLSASPHRRVLKAARDRGWLLAPSLRQVAESSLAALRAGTLPDVAVLPVSSPSPSSTPPRSSPSPSPQPSLPSTSLSASPLNSLADSDDLDTICRGIETALRTANTRSPFNAKRPHTTRTPSPTRSDSSSDDPNQLALRTVTRRPAVPEAVNSPTSPLQPDRESEDLGEPAPLPQRRGAIGLVTPPWRREAETNNDELDGLCRGLETALRLPHDHAELYSPFDVDKAKYLLPALKGAAQWLGLAALPFERVRERAADRLLMLFDREVLAGRLVKNAQPRERVTLAWSGRLTKTAGVTRMRRLACGTRTAAIELSEKVVDEPARLYNTLAHELCHAAAWIIDECCKPPHGEQFKSWAREFKRWDNRLVITTCHEYEIRYKFKYKCQECGQIYGRHSRSINTSTKVCGKCRGTLQLVKEL